MRLLRHPAGHAPAAFVHEDDDMVAIVDLRPVTTGHLLVLPRHPADGFVLDADWRVREREELAEVAAKVRAAIVHATSA
ncbi:hypothetical protein Amsp01_066640 [Amycolatopsis sp. NBRC 101858]|uniref:HIT family protein n=1 Tax=Amycolatopsis sp. NBRC 101858 TaxID=3032200 RepID=UPI0024A38258|nr:HIT domain-containing protein [Amycolatopsis sp. NBRC 101858]GLY40641.1 hypothetical protein Amsp01_066640 [Amycolatopsis sp. NBRC 101858]